MIANRAPFPHAVVALARRAARIALAAAIVAGCAGRRGPVGSAVVSAGSAPAGSAAPPSSRVDGAARCDVASVSDCAGGSPSFARDVKPILQRRCYRGHAADGVAAEEHDLSDLATLHAQRAELTDAITTCSMPPRAPLSNDDAHALLRWLACGARTD